jgi:hypothetical protein
MKLTSWFILSIIVLQNLIYGQSRPRLILAATESRRGVTLRVSLFFELIPCSCSSGSKRTVALKSLNFLLYQTNIRLRVNFHRL